MMARDAVAGNVCLMIVCNRQNRPLHISNGLLFPLQSSFIIGWLLCNGTDATDGCCLRFFDCSQIFRFCLMILSARVLMFCSDRVRPPQPPP